MHTLIRLLLLKQTEEEQFDQSLHCLLRSICPKKKEIPDSNGP